MGWQLGGTYFLFPLILDRQRSWRMVQRPELIGLFESMTLATIDKVWFNWGFLIKILSSIKSRLYRWSLHTTHHHHHHHPRKLSFANSQPPVVRFEHVRTIFDSTQSQESKSEVSLHKITRQCALRPILCPLLFLSSLWSNLSMWGHFLIVLNLRNPNLRSACAKERGNAHYWPFYVLCCFSAPSGPIWACEDTFWEYSISRIQIWDRLAQKYAAIRTMTQSVFLVFWV